MQARFICGGNSPEWHGASGDDACHRKPKIEEAHKVLRSNVRGFFVEMPVDWEAQGSKTPHPPIRVKKMIASHQAAPAELKETST